MASLTICTPQPAVMALGDRQHLLAGLQKPSRGASTSRGEFRWTKNFGFWDPSSSCRPIRPGWELFVKYQQPAGHHHGLCLQGPESRLGPPSHLPSSRESTSTSQPLHMEMHSRHPRRAAAEPSQASKQASRHPSNAGRCPRRINSWL